MMMMVELLTGIALEKKIRRLERDRRCFCAMLERCRMLALVFDDKLYREIVTLLGHSDRKLSDSRKGKTVEKRSKGDH